MAVRFDDQFPIHRKVGALSDAAFRLHVEAICWSARNLTDGVIRADELLTVTRTSRPERYAAELVRRGVWRETADGWEIHDYLDWQSSRSKVLTTRQERRKAGQAGGLRSAAARAKTAPPAASLVAPPAAPPAASLATPLVAASESKVRGRAKQLASTGLDTGLNPEPPRPPYGGARREGERDRVSVLQPRHPFADDGVDWCSRCGLPRINKIHSIPR